MKVLLNPSINIVNREELKELDTKEVLCYNMYELDIRNIPKLDKVKVTKKFLKSIRKYYSDRDLSKYFGISILRFKFMILFTK